MIPARALRRFSNVTIPKEIDERERLDGPPFEFGDKTMYKLKAQGWALENQDDFGTMVVRPSALVPAGSDREAPQQRPQTVEQKIDMLIRAVDMLQKRIDSLDVVLSRFLNR
jgi:hypothetical protein